MTRRRLSVDGQPVEVDAALGESLLSVLRSAGRTAPKLACGRGECGACTVQIDGRPVMSCAILAATVTGDVVTAESVARTSPDLGEAFADNIAFQCGFCTPGQIVRADALLRDNPCPSRAEVAQGMIGNVCRCTGYVQIVDAVCDVARQREAAPQ
ncbi:(2Fe-2S)-binding protein [Aeromicrobium sp. UC242_57]|uniref:(2Fe-2S)-binding protein n=1 Tax=Aeromicrobium sp. UC242_57 TaxID=3374624 RepID=UPI0037B6BF92